MTFYSKFLNELQRVTELISGWWTESISLVFVVLKKRGKVTDGRFTSFKERFLFLFLCIDTTSSPKGFASIRSDQTSQSVDTDALCVLAVKKLRPRNSFSFHLRNCQCLSWVFCQHMNADIGVFHVRENVKIRQ